MAEEYIDIEINGVLIPRCKIMPAQYKGKCSKTGKWFEPGTVTIAFKHKNDLTEQQKKAVFGDKQVYHVTVIVDNVAVVSTNPPVSATNKPAKKEWTPSRFQSYILDMALKTESHLFIEALAGCGKTATLVWLVKKLQSLGKLLGKQVIYLAFNKSIQEELAKHLIGTGCPAMTTHSFGLSLLKRQFKELERAGKAAISNGKMGDLFIQMLASDLYGDLSAASLKKAKQSDHYACRSSVVGSRGLVSFIKNWAIIPTLTNNGYVFSDEQKERVKGFIKEYEISVPEDFTENQLVNYACRVVAESIPLPGNALTRITYDDMLYLPLALKLPFPHYDLVLTDESQDFNEAQEQTLFRLADKGARCAVVGDIFQAMYKFRAADSKAFQRIKTGLETTERGVVTCELPINYRSDEAIIQHARQWVPKLEGRGVELGQQKGELSFDATYSQALQTVNNDGIEEFAFLCRINVPLVVTAYQLIAQGKRVCIIGRQAIASPMLSIIDDLCGSQDRYGNFPEHYTDRITDRRNEKNEIVEEGLLTRLANYYRSQTAKFTEEKHETALEDLTNNVDCIEIIAGRVREDSVKAVIKEIESLFVENPEDKGTIKLSTVHRAKGLEWDVVFILRPELMPHPNVKPNLDGSWSEDQQQEENIRYVASTRARHKLHYVCNWPFGRGKGTRLTSGFIPVVPQPVVEVETPKPVVVQKPVEVPKPVEKSGFVDDGEPF